ncbi:MAG: hypothetical protein CVV30_03935 [Methanomicrobiales archaeon HGW-Methanomicrobiales-1]|jgi:hypothetical protein|nr:MAG: hypothetical protein CVV30_03935 [Methanomicrobiales archaeon HGW-Methanomicrobiales-1]
MSDSLSVIKTDNGSTGGQQKVYEMVKNDKRIQKGNEWEKKPVIPGNKSEMSKIGEKKKHPQLVGERNPFAVYRIIHNIHPIHHTKSGPLSHLDPVVKLFSEMTFEEVRNCLTGLANSDLTYDQLFDPRWGSCLFCQKTIDAVRMKHIHVEANPDTIVPDQKSKSSSETYSTNALVGGPPDYLKCTQNLANATWELKDRTKPNDPASLPWNWMTPIPNPIYYDCLAMIPPWYGDPYQGDVLDCYLLAALSSIAWYYAANKPVTKNKIDADPTMAIKFLKTDNTPIQVVSNQVLGTVVTDYSLPLDPQSLPVGAKTKTGVSWVPFYEKAFTRYLETIGTIVPPSDPYHPDICRIPCGDAGETLRALMNRNTNYLKIHDMKGKPIGSDERDPIKVWTKLKGICETLTISKTAQWNAWKAKYPAVAWTNCTRDPDLYQDPPPHPDCAAPHGSGVEYVSDPITASHAYSLMGLHMLNSVQYVIFRDPWGESYGYDPEQTAYSLSPGPLIFYSILDTAGVRYSPTIFDGQQRPLNGVFALKIEDFVKFFAAFSWVIT